MQFSVYPDRARGCISEFQNIEGELRDIYSGLEDAIKTNAVQSKSYDRIKSNMKICQQNMQTVMKDMSRMRTGLKKVADVYDRYEKNIRNRARYVKPGKIVNINGSLSAASTPISQLFPSPNLHNPLGALVPPSQGAIGGAGVVFLSGLQNGGVPQRGGFGYNDSKDGKFSWSVVGGKDGWHSDYNGVDIGNDWEYHVVHLKAEGKKRGSWDIEKGNVGAEAVGTAGFSVIDGKLSGNIGLLKGEVEGSVGNIGVEGGIGATLFSGGQFAPAIYGKVKGEANVAKGEASSEFGTDEFNTHVGVGGTLLGAEAEAKVQVGRVVGKDGTVRTGIQGKAGAEAYIAEGSVKGGFTLWGIKIDGVLEGKAGGAGVKAGGEISTGGVEGEIGLGVLVGGGVKVKVDWTNFKPPWKKLKFPWQK